MRFSPITYSLPRWVYPEQYEPPHGCLLRLAECNGLPGTKEIRSITGLRIGRIRLGGDLDQLAPSLIATLPLLRRTPQSTKTTRRRSSAGIFFVLEQILFRRVFAASVLRA
jgi:hypothetical protein